MVSGFAVQEAARACCVKTSFSVTPNSTVILSGEKCLLKQFCRKRSMAKLGCESRKVGKVRPASPFCSDLLAHFRCVFNQLGRYCFVERLVLANLDRRFNHTFPATSCEAEPRWPVARLRELQHRCQLTATLKRLATNLRRTRRRPGERHSTLWLPFPATCLVTAHSNDCSNSVNRG